MELMDYWRVIRRWSVLIVAGTLLSAIVGYGVSVQNQGTAHPTYRGTATVLVNYVTPPGVAYIPTLSVHTQTELLSSRVSDPNALRLVTNRAGVAISEIRQVTTSVHPEKPLITVEVLGSSAHAAQVVAQGMAQYLDAVETQQVKAQSDSLSRTAARDAAQAKGRWLAAQAHYYTVCGCIADQHQARTNLATLARLRANLDVLQASYLSAASRYTAVQTNPIPVAAITPGSVAPVVTRYASPLNTVLPATVLGLLLSIGLAAFLDYKETGSHLRVSPTAAGTSDREEQRQPQTQIRELGAQLVSAQDQLAKSNGAGDVTAVSGVGSASESPL
jgi:hypothetical protein